MERADGENATKREFKGLYARPTQWIITSAIRGQTKDK